MAVAVAFLGDWTQYFAVIGFVTFSVFSFTLLWTIWRWLTLFVVAPAVGQNAYLKSLGSWAVVTGATDGIGKGYVKQFAQIGIDVVLISRSPSKLDSVATEIEKEYNVKTKTVVADFSHGHEIYDHIRDQLQGMDIGILVNNVGFSPPVDYYLNIPPQETFKVLRVNLGSMLMMTHLVLPAMVEKRKGAVINISSVTAVVPFPLSSVYSASKAFMDSFTKSLRAEYESSGVTFQCVLPLFVVTNMNPGWKENLLVHNADSYTEQAVQTIGREERTFGALSHAVQGLVVERAPHYLILKFFKSLTLEELNDNMSQREEAEKNK